MKKVHIAAAIIVREVNGRKEIYSSQRGYGQHKDWWEFPGGKIEAGESAEEAVKREIMEELDTEIRVDEFFITSEYQYPDFFLTMECFLCSIVKGELILKEAEDFAWLSKEDLRSVKWLPADEVVLDKLEQWM